MQVMCFISYITIIIIEEICTAPIFHIEWKDRALYNSSSNTLAPTHAHACTGAHAHTHTHTHKRTLTHTYNRAAFS